MYGEASNAAPLTTAIAGMALLGTGLASQDC